MGVRREGGGTEGDGRKGGRWEEGRERGERVRRRERQAYRDTERRGKEKEKAREANQLLDNNGNETNCTPRAKRTQPQLMISEK